MARYSTWEVAAAILLIEEGPASYSYLTTMVLATGLSGLGARGGKTPERSLNKELNQRYEVFKCEGYQGDFVLKEPDVIASMPKVQEIVDILKKANLERDRLLERKDELQAELKQVITKLKSNPSHKRNEYDYA